MAVIRKSLTFPMAGVARRAGYREQSRPYSAPWAYNVRGTDAAESRQRGGSRPGMTRVFDANVANIAAVVPLSVVNGDNKVPLLAILNESGGLSIGNPAANSISAIEATLLWDDGETILWDDGSDIVFDSVTDAVTGVERGGKVLLPGSVLQEYDPQTGVIETIAADLGEVPSDCPLICVYRDRVFLAGKNHIWYASRQSDFSDWHLAGDMNDDGRPVAGHLALSGDIGDKITAMIPMDDARLIMATERELWMLDGDPTTGSLRRFSDATGIVSGSAWAKAPDGTVAFLGLDGVFVLSGTKLDRWSSEVVPDALKVVDTDTIAVAMGWDNEGRGFHLFLTPVDGTSSGLHWWLNYGARSMWPVKFILPGHDPVAVGNFSFSGIVSSLAVAGRDGYIRLFDPGVDDDDGYTIVSQVVIGPFRLPSDDMTDAILTTIAGSIGGESDVSVNWLVVTGNSAEEVADAAKDAVDTLQAGLLVSAYRSGVWGYGRNRISRPRSRGPWAAVCLYSETQWAFESVVISGITAGRLRDGN